MTPIVAEVRGIRDKLAAECGYEIKEIFRRVWERQVKSGLYYYYVRYPARRTALPKGGRGPNMGRMKSDTICQELAP